MEHEEGGLESACQLERGGCGHSLAAPWTLLGVPVHEMASLQSLSLTWLH